MKENEGQCGIYFLVLPKKHKEKSLRGISIKQGKDYSFNLELSEHSSESNMMAVVCTRDEWLKSAELTVQYVALPSTEEIVSLCASYYDYSNLFNYLRR